MALNLVRNSKVFFTTNVDSLGKVLASGFDATNTHEIQVLDGFTFSQNTNSDTVTISEGGAAPVRGQRAFNTSLAPVDFSFSNYIRPSFNDDDSVVECEENVLWNAISGTGAIGGAGAGWVADAAFSKAEFANSNAHQLQKFGMIFIVDQVAYAVDNCSLNQVTIDFGLDAIATGAWTGQGTTLRQLGNGITAVGGTFGGTGIAGAYKAKNTTANYITNKLSTVALSLVKDLKDAAGNTVAATGTAYNVALTGGSITINNNINYITPANLGTVNVPVTYYTGQRAVSGTINAYLKTGASETGTGKLLANMLTAASATVEPMFAMAISIGGGANAVKVVLDMPSIVLTIPTVDVQQVISTAINFTAQGSTGSGNSAVYDLTQTNDITVKYYSPDLTV
jgi:hypothetical protein